MGDSKILRHTVIASIVLHVVLAVFLPAKPEGMPPVEQRIKLSLAPTGEPRTFTETPPDARTPEPPPDPTHLAEHNARAQNPELATELSDRPRSEGDVETFDFRKSDLLNAEAKERSEARQASRRPSERQSDGESEKRQQVHARRGDDFAVADAGNTNSRQAGAESSEPGGRVRPRPDQRKTGVSAQGELSLSTYAWAWAPYLRHLRDAIDERWQPPLAFYMGLVEGDGSIRFRVHPDGTATLVEVIEEEGHPSLSRAAKAAVEHAVPFRPLPESFPEPHLDVTWSYRYIVLGR